MSSVIDDTFTVGATALTQFVAVKTPAALVVTAADTDVALGIVQSGFAIGASGRVRTSGPSKAIAAAGIAKGVKVCATAAGQVKTAVTGDLVFGYTREAAGAQGDIIEIVIEKNSVVLA